MRHGGPDDEGIYTDNDANLVLGHRRLSLIDLSASGHQPMTYSAGRFVLSFNGEIYNYREIKAGLLKAGFTFQTESDTEVILAAFAAWGTKSFERLNGMFAFALWDNQESKLYLARDASGIKPLYYSADKNGVAFSSEIRGFKPIPYLQEENKDWPVFFLAYGHLPEPVTILKNVHPLQKGHFLCYDQKKATSSVHPFKQFEFSHIITKREDAVSLVREKLQKAVERHLIADAPIGVFLSGGVDSSIISLLACADKQTRLNTLSLYFEENDFSEKKYQDILLDQMNCGRSQHLLKEEEFHAFFPTILKAMDQPSCDGINTWFISKFARENGLKAVLSGIGGDELYGGYPSFKRMQKVNLLEKLPEKILKSGKYSGAKALKRLGYLSLGGAAGKYLFLRGQFIPSEIARQLDMPEGQVWKILADQPVFKNIEDISPFDQASWLELNMFMQNQLLRDVDVMGMAHGIEIRVPFLDKDFVDLSMKISDPVKSEGQLPKQLLIDAFRDILPEAIWNRPKMGFGFPFKKWLTNEELVQRQFNPADKNYQRFVEGKMHWSQFLALVLVRERGVDAGNFAGIQRKPLLSDKKKKDNNVSASSKKILLLTLRTFSLTGGIEKVSKVVGRALYELGEESGDLLTVYSMYDDSEDLDEKYLPQGSFTGFNIHRMKFTREAVLKGSQYDVVVLSHINLLPVGYLIKKLSPKTRLILIAHGIEVWKTFSGMRRQMLFKCDNILSVSRFTKEKICDLNHFPAEKIQVLNNCLDPFLEKPVEKEKDCGLLKKYDLNKEDIILMTLTRLSSREKYKGYDVVIKSLSGLRKTNPHLKYLIIGKYDDKEKERLDKLLEESGLSAYVIFTGFVPDKELAQHFNLADIYIMPSEKEGFGIVFIEAMYYHKPVIAGNKDGSVDALLNGRLGMLVNPQSQEEISKAIAEMIDNKDQRRPDNQLLMNHFSYPVYKEKWKGILESL